MNVEIGYETSKGSNRLCVMLLESRKEVMRERVRGWGKDEE